MRTLVGDVTYRLKDPNADSDASQLLQDDTFSDELGIHVPFFGFTLTLGSSISLSSGFIGTTLDVLNEAARGWYSLNLLAERKIKSNTWNDFHNERNLAAILLRPFSRKTRNFVRSSCL
jgi:hypothetical protein